MYIPGTIIYFIPFYFSDGSSKNKYFLVLAAKEDNMLIASLPTSKDHIPNSMQKKHGCINDNENRINCYFFEKGKIISECGTFGFPRDTYIYGEQIAAIDKKAMQIRYKESGEDYEISCKLSESEFQAVKECLRQSGVVKRILKKYL